MNLIFAVATDSDAAELAALHGAAAEDLTRMSVHPGLQRKGVGRLLLNQAESIARARPADAVRLDAFDAAAGAGPFYPNCGKNPS